MKIIDHVARAGGGWGDIVTLPDGRFAWLYGVSKAAVCEIDGREVWRKPVPTDFLRYTRATAVPQPACMGQGGDDHGYEASASGAVPVGPAPLQNSVGYGLDGTRYIVRGADSYTKGAETCPMPWTSQGIRDVMPDGTVVFGDATLAGSIGGHDWWQYQRRPGWVVGQAGTNVGLAVMAGTDYLVIARPGDPLGVHGALSLDGRYLAVCAFTVWGAERWTLDLGPGRVSGPVSTGCGE